MEKLIDLSKAGLPLLATIAIISGIVTTAVNFGWTQATVAANARTIEAFPDKYVTKDEYNATVSQLTDRLNSIDKSLQSINNTMLQYKFEVKN